MRGFHICNVAQFRPDYLKKWLKRLSELGYDTVIWELENSVKWESCPECAAPDALSKDEFREILSFSRKLGLEPVPLFQVLGHCEYVLKQPGYSHLAESPGCISQYCPSNPQVLDFLRKWINEYLELFGDIKHFHLGMDEARHLGECPDCGKLVAEHSKSELYIRHVNTMSASLIKNGVRTIIWADMLLAHPEALDSLSREIILFDWMYDIRRNNDKVWVWGKGKCDKDSLPPEMRKLFEAALFPLGDEPGREPDTFYTADFLAGNGFDVVTCPASSSYGDNVFSPRHFHHLRNTFDSFSKSAEKKLYGSVLTSWTVHLFPWELQAACIGTPSYLAQAASPSIEGCQDYLAAELFGVESVDFWKAAGLLSKTCLFSYTASLGFNQSWLPVPPDFFSGKLKSLAEQGTLRQEYENSLLRLAEYEEGEKLFEALAKTVRKGNELIAFWRLAARNLVNRAKASICLLEIALNVSDKTQSAGKVLAELNAVKSETEAAYRGIVLPVRCKEVISLMYDGVAAELGRQGDRTSQ